MNWKKGGLWIIVFFTVKGTLSTLLIITGAKYFNLSYMQIFLLVIVLLMISYSGRKFLQRRKKVKSQKELNM
jgi:membrane protein implicated in regulation of membrane protease activity